MQVTVLKEEGHTLALQGMTYSFMDNAENPEIWFDNDRFIRSAKRAAVLAHKQGGHNKFLESIQVWIDINAPRAWWSEFDTYRAGVTKQSTSTMHLLAKRAPDYSDFEEGTSDLVIDAFIKTWYDHKDDIHTLKMNLPEGFLQRRIVCTNYKALQNIIAQRHDHRLKLWAGFCFAVLDQVEHPEYLWENK